ncbi:hypothetical protein [Mycoplasmoides pirum]|uniref:hypothetical protein n=1 Tax=Mycoplasmoides pirum TaxID=2122 RepID=UPI000484B2F2|nr:hypothetical protein [Mycoplasmoides pirum]
MTFEWWTIPVIILIVLGIVLFVYMIIAFRRMSISAKKLDYLIEDLSYKSEKIAPVVDSLVKLLNYVDLFDDVLKAKGIKILNNALENKEDLSKAVQQLKELLASHNDPKKIN